MEQFPSPKNTEQRSEQHRTRAEQILTEFNIQEGKPVPLNQLKALVVKYKQEIVEGLSRNFYHAIKSSLYTDRTQAIRNDFYLLRPVNRGNKYHPEATEKSIDFIWYLETGSTKPIDKWKQNDEEKLVFTFHTGKERIDDEIQHNSHNSFSGYEAFSVEQIFQTAVPLEDFDDKKKRESFLEITDTDNSHINVSAKNVRALLQRALEEPETFDDALAKIDIYWEKYGFSLEEREKLKQAVWEFGNHDFKSREGIDVMGQCGVISLQFEKFVHDRFGITLENAELLGAARTRQSYSLEERAELDRERAELPVHNASLYKRTVIIDWTSRQFNNQLPLPEIRDLNDNGDLKKRIVINGEL